MAFEPGRLRFFFVSPGLRDEFLLAEERGSRALDWQNQLQISRISMVWETNEASLSIGSGGSLGFHRVAARSGETSPHPTDAEMSTQKEQERLEKEARASERAAKSSCRGEELSTLYAKLALPTRAHVNGNKKNHKEVKSKRAVSIRLDSAHDRLF
ncbi:MAG: hypothetical protein SGPRY_009995 [Prymnesium sp.]